MSDVELRNSTKDSLSCPAVLNSGLVMVEVNTKESQEDTRKPPMSITE